MLKAIKTVLALAACLFAAQAQSSEFPDRPIRVIVPFAAGGSVDAIARVLAEKMRQDLGQPMVIENNGTAGGMVAFDQVVRTKPDGYTLLIGASSYTTIAALRKLPYDPVKDITPVTLVNTGPLILTVSASTPAKNLKEFVELLKAKPGALNFGSPGIGSGSHFAGALFQQASGTSMVHIPYRSDAAVLAALLSGEIQVAMASGPALRPLLEADKVRALAVTSDRSWPTLPELPTTAEIAPGARYLAWNGVWGPGGMPPAIVNRLNQAYARALALPDVQQRLRADIREPAPSTPEEFGNVIAREIVEWTAVAKAANITLD